MTTDLDLTRVPVLLRWMLSGDGTLARETSVYCPYQSRILDAATCGACRYAGRSEVCSSGPGELYLGCCHPPNGDVEYNGGSADHTRVSQVMPNEVFCVTEDVYADDLISLFIERGFSGAPVVDGDWKPLGIVSKSDLVWERYNGEQSVGRSLAADDRLKLGNGFHLERERSTVGEIMTPLALTVTVDTALSQAAAIMASERVHRVPVVSPDRCIVGVLSSLDVLGWLGQTHGYVYREAVTSCRPRSRTSLSEKIGVL